MDKRGIEREVRRALRWENGAIMVRIDDPRYDRDEVIRAIEAIGG